MNDVEFQKLLDAPAPVVIKAKKWPYLVPLLLMGTYFSLKWYHENSPIFALSFVAMAVLATLRSVSPYALKLELNKENFFIYGVWGKESFSWSQVSSFDTRYRCLRRFNKTVCFNDESVAPWKQPWEELIRYRYDITPDQLAQLMNHWRERVLAGK